MRRCERRCEDEKVRRWEDEIQTPLLEEPCAQTFSGKNTFAMFWKHDWRRSSRGNTACGCWSMTTHPTHPRTLHWHSHWRCLLWGTFGRMACCAGGRVVRPSGIRILQVIIIIIARFLHTGLFLTCGAHITWSRITYIMGWPTCGCGRDRDARNHHQPPEGKTSWSMGPSGHTIENGEEPLDSPCLDLEVVPLGKMWQQKRII